MPAEMVDFVVLLFGALRDGVAAQATGVVRALTGRDARGFGEFARDHAAAFGDRGSAYASTSPRRIA
jgi:hypothetical protein